MIRKFILSLMFCCILVSCGKKGDPKYKEPEKRANKKLLLINEA